MSLKHADAVEFLSTLDSGVVDLVCSDLPSGKTRALFDVQCDVHAFQREVARVLKPAGKAVLMASHLKFVVDLLGVFEGWRCHDLIWEKGNATGFLNAGRQPLRAHEFILVFHRKSGTYNRVETEGHKPTHSCVGKAGRHGANYGAVANRTFRGGKTTRAPRSVLRISNVAPNARERIHPQQKPTQLLERLIEMYSNPSDLVVDPYAGSATTGVAAARLGRRFLGCEKDEDLFRKAEERLRASGAR